MLFCAILGTVEEIHIRSLRESWLRRKYMGVWSRGSRKMRAVIPEFPKEVRTNSKMIRCNRSRPVWV